MSITAMVHSKTGKVIYIDLDIAGYVEISKLKMEGYLEIPVDADILTDENTFYKEEDGELYYMYMEWRNPEWIKCQGKLEDFHEWEIVWKRKV